MATLAIARAIGPASRSLTRITLIMMGRHDQALTLLERALTWIPDHLPTPALSVFHYMALAYRELDRPMPAHHLPRFLAAADKRHDIDEDLQAHPELFRQAAIDAYTSKTRQALDRRCAAVTTSPE